MEAHNNNVPPTTEAEPTANDVNNGSQLPEERNCTMNTEHDGTSPVEPTLSPFTQYREETRLRMSVPEYRKLIDRIHALTSELRGVLARPGDIFIGSRIDEVAYCLAQDPDAADILNETVGLYRQAFDRLDEADIASHRHYTPSQQYTPSPAIIDVIALTFCERAKTQATEGSKRHRGKKGESNG